MPTQRRRKPKPPEPLITENPTSLHFRGDTGEGVLDLEVNVGQRTFAGNDDQWLCLSLASGDGWFFTKPDARRLLTWLAARLRP